MELLLTEDTRPVAEYSWYHRLQLDVFLGVHLIHAGTVKGTLFCDRT